MDTGSPARSAEADSAEPKAAREQNAVTNNCRVEINPRLGGARRPIPAPQESPGEGCKTSEFPSHQWRAALLRWRLRQWHPVIAAHAARVHRREGNLGPRRKTPQPPRT